MIYEIHILGKYQVEREKWFTFQLLKGNEILTNIFDYLLNFTTFLTERQICSKREILAIPSKTSGVNSASEISLKKEAATDSKASAGHSLNQSMVQQVTSDGNCLSRARNTSPIGLNCQETERSKTTSCQNRLC